MCILPVDYRSEGQTNLVGQTRTLKTMQSTLSGVPIVSSRWVKECMDEECVKRPSSMHFVRTLPMKVTEGLTSDFGVAHVACALQRDDTFRVLEKHSVYLCKPYSQSKLSDITSLVKMAGAELLPTATAALRAAKKMSDESGTMVILTDDDVNSGIPPALQDLIYKSPSRYVIVNSHWLFDSISTGKPLAPVEVYQPPSPRGCELWIVTISCL
jgi:hypothetical protein